MNVPVKSEFLERTLPVEVDARVMAEIRRFISNEIALAPLHIRFGLIVLSALFWLWLTAAMPIMGLETALRRWANFGFPFRALIRTLGTLTLVYIAERAP